MPVLDSDIAGEIAQAKFERRQSRKKSETKNARRARQRRTSQWQVNEPQRRAAFDRDLVLVRKIVDAVRSKLSTQEIEDLQALSGPQRDYFYTMFRGEEPTYLGVYYA